MAVSLLEWRGLLLPVLVLWLLVLWTGDKGEVDAVWSPHSESCVAMERRSRAADSWAETRVLADLMRRWRRLERAGWELPRNEGKEKGLRVLLLLWVECCCWWLKVLELEVGAPEKVMLLLPLPEDRLEDRKERARPLDGGLVMGEGRWRWMVWCVRG